MSEIQESFALQKRAFIRVVLVTFNKGEGHLNRIFGLSQYGEIKQWDRNKWRVLRKMADHKFADIIVHKGLMYALDTQGIVWWINSRLEICMYGPPVDDNITYSEPGDKSFVECCGELYIVDRICNRQAGVYFPNAETVGFKVYKFDEELGQMMEVKSLGDKAFVLATDTGFSVLAHEYYGCLQNSIYFKDGEKELNVFKLDNGIGSSITTMSQFSQSCFQMFFPSFL
ncbi:PREDICTED: putative F-box protein At1g65770 [Camelina sativa]|uniref:F-box protein At1g65770 n=1 Tax=Camelina sativa TaxID=90675 RepID=A0ABM0WPC9_CAMSA|nr:PREDICTED: putative F-box protein At1g65770 [Camelina sativa]